MMRLQSIQVGRPRFRVSGSGRRWRTAFFKDPVERAVALRAINLDGDQQGDIRVHGGPEMAVLCYSAGHYPAWREELGLPEMGPGGFGENFTIAGADEWSVCIGDVLEVGDAVVQVSQPRGPCWKIAERWERPDLLKRVEASGRHGWYLRVLQEGTVEAGFDIRLLARPQEDWTVRRAADTYRWRKWRPEDAAALAAIPELAPRPKAELARVASAHGVDLAAFGP